MCGTSASRSWSETRRLQRKLAQAETIIGIQKKVATLLGIPLKRVDDEASD